MSDSPVRFARCRHCGGFSCTALCLMLTSPGTVAWTQSPRPLPSPAAATSVVPSMTAATAGGTAFGPVGSTTGVEIGGMFMAVPVQPQLEPAAADGACGNADCFRGIITVRANMRWQLQVRYVGARLPQTTVWWRPPVSGMATPLLGEEWLTVLTGPVPTSGTSVALRFAARVESSTAARRAPVSPSVLSSALEYRVVAW